MDQTFRSDCKPFTICFNSDDCWDANDPYAIEANSWRVVVIFASLGTLCLALAELAPRNKLLQTILYDLHEIKANVKLPVVLGDAKDEEETLTEVKPSQSFVRTERSEENFVRDNDDPKMMLPLRSESEYEPSFANGAVLPVTGFLCRQMGDVFSASLFSILIGSVGWALLAGAFSTFFYLFLRYQETCGAAESIAQLLAWAEEVSASFSKLISDYNFFPIFLLVGYIGFVVDRWRDWLRNCHTIQGRLNDIAMLVGASVGPCPEIKVRKRLYKIYRYLTLVHAMTYKSSSPTLSHLDYEIDFVDKLGLLTPLEAYDLASADNMPQKHVYTWLTAEIQMLLRMKDVMSEHTGLQIASLLAECRSLCSKHNDLFVRDNPNLYVSLMTIVVNIMLLLFTVAYPFALMVRTPTFFPGLPAVQPLVILGVFVQTFAIRSAYGLLVRLRNPFSWTVDRIKVDALLASTDRSTFIHLRAMFCGATVQEDEFDVEWGYHSKENLGIEALLEGDMSCADLSCSTAKTTRHCNGLEPQTPWSRSHQTPRKRPALPKGASVVLHNRELLIPGLEMRAEI